MSTLPASVVIGSEFDEDGPIRPPVDELPVRRLVLHEPRPVNRGLGCHFGLDHSDSAYHDGGSLDRMRFADGHETKEGRLVPKRQVISWTEHHVNVAGRQRLVFVVGPRTLLRERLRVEAVLTLVRGTAVDVLEVGGKLEDDGWWSVNYDLMWTFTRTTAEKIKEVLS